MSASLAAQIHAIALNPTPAGIAELPAIAAKVGRLERRLDEIVEDGRESEKLLYRPVRRRPRLRVVT